MNHPWNSPNFWSSFMGENFGGQVWEATSASYCFMHIILFTSQNNT